jgi:hypothetical protein
MQAEQLKTFTITHRYSSPWGHVAMKELMFLKMPPPFSTMAVLLNRRGTIFRLILTINVPVVYMFLGLLDPAPDPLVRGMDPDPAPDPSIIKQKQ